MSTGEFDLIGRYFSIQKGNQHFVDFSIGDDCAITHIPEGYQLAITTDTMVEGTHFLSSIYPQDLAYKAIATNLSDLAAMGAKPAWISLALTLPEVNENWLNQFSQSLFDTLNQYDVTLIGGDTTKGPLSVTITAQGFVPKGKALFRHNAKVGDLIYVSGTLGDSAAGLNWILQGKSAVDFDTEFLVKRHFHPTPRVELGQALVNVAHSCIDISDGLVADLGHILTRSQCSAEIDLSFLPLSTSLKKTYSLEKAEAFALSGGEDYELCFTIPANKKSEIEKLSQSLKVPCTCIGKIVPQNNNQITFLKDGRVINYQAPSGFDHFKDK